MNINSRHIESTAIAIFVGLLWGYWWGSAIEETSGKPFQWLYIGIPLAIFGVLATIECFLAGVEPGEVPESILLLMFSGMCGSVLFYSGVVNMEIGGIILGLLFLFLFTLFAASIIDKIIQGIRGS